MVEMIHTPSGLNESANSLRLS